MYPEIKQRLTSDLQGFLDQYSQAQELSKYNDLSDLHIAALTGLVAQARAAVRRVAGPGSAHEDLADGIMREDRSAGWKACQLAGVVTALLHDVQEDRLEPIAELIHGELFGDFLEMADHLLEQGYKDPAAVVAGAALEAHLRLLCRKHAVDPTYLATSGPRPKKADQINSDLVKAKAYEPLDQKSVTAWLDLRNHAAHGDFGKYTADQVALMIQGIRDFITRKPA